MAQQVTTTVTDDIDGSKNAQTVNFALDGVEYEIDLGKKNATALRKVLQEFITAGRATPPASRVATASTRRTGRAATKSESPNGKPDVKAVREWAAANGIETSSRGRIASSVVEQYLAAQ